MVPATPQRVLQGLGCKVATHARIRQAMEEAVQLDFENQMFIELLAEDGMVVLAK